MGTRIIITTLWVAVFSLTLPGVVWADKASAQITVTGQGRVAATPDMATINLGVTNQAKDAGAAMAATSESTAKILQRLGDMGVEARDMQTSSLTLNPIWSDSSSSGSGTPDIAGFVASNLVLVRVRDLSDLGRIMGAVIDDGANNFNGLRFTVQDPDPLLNKARQLAVADAMAKAELLTTAAGVPLGKVQSMIEQGGGRPVMMEMDSARLGAVPIAAGEVSISASVTMTFAIGD